jgi:steroid delta-isomerase-like uncharacterized protein
MRPGELVALCERWQEGLRSQDARVIEQLYSEDAEIQSPMAGSVSGREGIAKLSEAFFSAFPHPAFVFEPPIISDDRAAIAADVTAQHVGRFMGLAPTGRSVHFTIVFLLDFRDGFIVRDRRIYDFTGLLVQVGVLKAKPA